MCGIAGCIDFKNQPKREIVSRMLDSISYRGPDQKGIYFDKNVAMGIQRLSIIDLKSGDQPIYNEDKSVIVVFNGEIYNFLELKGELEKKGHKFKTKSDTETLVHLYETYGVNMPKYLKGMFCFAIWDKKKNSLFIARDHAGIKPLYFWKEGKTLLFGSELKAILSDGRVKKQLNLEAFRLYTRLGYVPFNLSIFENIYKLLPGHSLEFKKEGVKIRSFYEVPTKKKASEENLDTLLEDSVISHSISDVPLGVLLSGGIDSSLITYYLSKNIRNKINTFSIGFKEKSFDESYYARLVSKHLKTIHHHEIFTSKDLLRLFPSITQKLDEPLADPSLFPTFKVSALARKYVKVVLSGDGGDELFGGYPTYQGHIAAEQIRKIFPQSAANLMLDLLDLIPSSPENYAKAEIGKEFLKGMHLPLLKRHLLWMSLKNYDPNFLHKQILSPLKNKRENLLRDLRKKINKSTVDDVIKTQLWDFQTYLQDDLLVKVDRASMYNSLEVRVPFLDPGVIENAFSQNSQVSLFSTKKSLRSLIKDKFPPAIFERRKKGFGIPLSNWINNDLEELVKDHLENPKIYNYFDTQKVNGLLKNHKERHQDNSKLIWMIVMFSAFLNEWY